MKLSERLHEMLLAGALADNAGGVFVDMRPNDFRALLREAAALARRVEGAQIREVEEEMHGLVIRAHPLQKGQHVRLVPDAGQEVGS